MQLENALSFAFGEFPTAGVATKADQVAAECGGYKWTNVCRLRDKDDMTVPEMGTYLITSAIQGTEFLGTY